MKRRALIMGVAAVALRVAPALAREPVSLVLAVPANRSDGMNQQIRRHVAQLYSDVQPGDRIVIVNASTQGVEGRFIVPDGIFETDRDRDDALLDSFAPINRFLAVNDPLMPVDNVNAPATLRDIGANVMAWFPGRKAHVILIGSAIWRNPHDANWSFREAYVLDGFLNERGGPFGVIGQEHLLDGALVSFLFTDPPDAFPTTGGEQHILTFWGKSIVGRGGHVGAIEPYRPGSYGRFFSADEDQSAYAIDPKAPRAVMLPGSVTTPVVTSGQPSKPKGNQNGHVATPGAGVAIGPRGKVGSAVRPRVPGVQTANPGF